MRTGIPGKRPLAAHPPAWKNHESCPSPSTTICRSTRHGPISAARPFAEIAARHGATVNVKPCKFGPIFEQTGGLPLPKRSPQRQAYRMMELKRWREVRDAPIHLEPKHFPSDDAAAVRLVIAAKLQGKNAHKLSLELGRALWEREETLADPGRDGIGRRGAPVSTPRRCAQAVLRTPNSTSCMSSIRRTRWLRAFSARRATCCLRAKFSGARTGWTCWIGR